jgi:hypothetical protein
MHRIHIAQRVLVGKILGTQGSGQQNGKREYQSYLLENEFHR